MSADTVDGAEGARQAGILPEALARCGQEHRAGKQVSLWERKKLVEEEERNVSTDNNGKTTGEGQ